MDKVKAIVTGGSAFPAFELIDNKGYGSPSEYVSTGGMTLRDYFAVHAPEAEVELVNLHNSFPDVLNQRVHQRYAYADAMLTARDPSSAVSLYGYTPGLQVAVLQRREKLKTTSPRAEQTKKKLKAEIRFIELVKKVLDHDKVLEVPVACTQGLERLVMKRKTKDVNSPTETSKSRSSPAVDSQWGKKQWYEIGVEQRNLELASKPGPDRSLRDRIEAEIRLIDLLAEIIDNGEVEEAEVALQKIRQRRS